MAAYKQQGASFVFGTDGGSWSFVNIGSYSEPIPVLDDTSLGTTGKRTKMPGDLGDPQSMTLRLQANVGVALPTKGLVQTGTITSPAGGFVHAETVAGTGFITDIKTAEFGSDSEGIQMIDIEWQFDGKTGPARTAATNS